MKKKNQWKITNIHTNKVSYFSVGFGNNKRSRYSLGTFVKGGLTVLISVLIIYGVVQAGTITPPSGDPTAQFYTLSEIYTRLTTNATSTEGGHDFTFSDSLAGTGRTLTEIYNAIPTIVANTVKLGTSYLGVAGTLVPSGGDAATANVLSGKTFFGDSQADWNLQTGTMTNVGQQTITPGTSTTTITQGYHDGTGYCEGDADLVSGNIKSGANIFNVAGELTPASGASEGLTATNAFCGSKYFGSGATSWTVQSGTGCPVCKECSAGSCVNMPNDTQDTTDDLGVAGTCDQVCKKCSAGSCANQASNEDLFAQCGGSSCCGYCDGSGSCAYVANGSTCTTPGDSCSGDYRCDGSGTCAYSPWNCGDALAYGGQNYATVQIGSQCWLAENLNIAPASADKGDCSGYGSKYCYGNNSANCDTYGGLYQWATVMCGESSSNSEPSGVQGICPDGWHLPSHYEWVTLERQVCSDIGNTGCDTTFPKDTSTTGWLGQDTTTGEGEGSALAGNAALWTNGDIDNQGAGNNDFGTSGFNLLPAGYRRPDGSYGGLGNYALVWSSLESDTGAWRRYLSYTYTAVFRSAVSKLYGFSVRCLKD